LKKAQIILLLLLVFIPLQIFAKRCPHEHKCSQPEEELCESYFYKQKFNHSTEKIMDWLAQSHQINTEIHLISLRKSPVGFHYSFVQMHNGVEIDNSHIKVNFNKKDELRSVFINRVKGLNFEPLINFSNEVVLSCHKKSINENDLVEVKHSYLIIDNLYQNCFTVSHENENGLFEYVYNSKLELTETIDKNIYACSGTDAVISGNIFNPDPLTSANAVYGGTYSDNNGANNASLTAELFMTNIDVCFDMGQYSPFTQHINVVDFAPPYIPIFTTSSTTTSFNRADNDFETLNLLYHLNQMFIHLNDLGYGDLTNYQLRVDPHGANGSDNSFYVPGGPQPSLQFGHGSFHVDDAEDADVIVHEYAHAISARAAPGTNIGFERQAIDEGFGDYIAASYSRSINPFNWEKVFSWDGHNEFWAGRTVGTNKKYPQDSQSPPHNAGQIWGGALARLHVAMGRERLDTILFASLYSYERNMNFCDAGELLVQAEEDLFNGELKAMLYDDLLEHGLICYADAGVTVIEKCKDESVALGATPLSNVLPGSIIKWEPAFGLDYDSVPNPIASSNIDTTYFVTVTTEKGKIYTDSIAVKTVRCEPYLIVKNSQNFALGLTNTIDLEISNLIGDASIRLYDVSGKLIMEDEVVQGNQALHYKSYELSDLRYGMYVFQVINSKHNETFKIIRF